MPTPRAGSDDTTTAVASGAVMGLVIESLRRVEDSLSRLSDNVTTQLARLPSDYVPRREVERRFDELTLDVGTERAERLAELKMIRDDAEKLRTRAETARRWLIATGVAAVGAGSAAVAAIVNILH